MARSRRCLTEPAWRRRGWSTELTPAFGQDCLPPLDTEQTLLGPGDLPLDRIQLLAEVTAALLQYLPGSFRLVRFHDGSLAGVHVGTPHSMGR